MSDIHILIFISNFIQIKVLGIRISEISMLYGEHTHTHTHTHTHIYIVEEGLDGHGLLLLRVSLRSAYMALNTLQQDWLL